MKITCQQCGADVPAENINIDRLIAKCHFCNAVFRFTEQLEPSKTSQNIEPLDVPMPKGIEVIPTVSSLRITRKWFSAKIVVLTFFTLFWDGFMLFWFGTAITQGIWIMAAFGTLHGAVGVGLTYYVLAGYLNSTVITVNRSLFTIRHGPLPWFGNKMLNAHDLTQLYCKESVHHSRNSTNYTYEAHAILKDDQHAKLVTGLDESEQALYLEQEIERFLEIEDRPVRGELRR